MPMERFSPLRHGDYRHTSLLPTVTLVLEDLTLLNTAQHGTVIFVERGLLVGQSSRTESRSLVDLYSRESRDRVSIAFLVDVPFP